MTAPPSTPEPTPRIRIAPTPSGYLHLGNAVNMLLIAELAARHRMTLVLRIDDIDHDRVRPEYVDDIFAMLDWLGIQPDIGPATTADLERTWGQHHRLAAYRGAARELLDGDRAYVCACSRSDWSSWTQPGCPRGCRDLALEPGRTVLRWRGRDEGDPVLWRREDIPAYHLTSVVDDDLMAITHVVRGADLEPSTALQRALAADLAGSGFARARVHHHRLVTDAEGRKLAKSSGGLGEPLPRRAATRAVVEATAHDLLEQVAWMPEC